MRVDGDLAGAAPVAVDRGAHVLSGHDAADLLLRRHVLPATSLSQRVKREGGVTIHLRARGELVSPAQIEILEVVSKRVRMIYP